MKKLSTKSSIRAAVFAVMGLSVSGIAMALGGQQNLTITLNVPVGAAPSDLSVAFIPDGTNQLQYVSGSAWSTDATLNSPTVQPGGAFNLGGNVEIYSQNNTLNSIDMYLAQSSTPSVNFGAAGSADVTIMAATTFQTSSPMTTMPTASATLPYLAGQNVFSLPGATSMAATTYAFDRVQFMGTVPTNATADGTGTVQMTVAATW